MKESRLCRALAFFADTPKSAEHSTNVQMKQETQLSPTDRVSAAQVTEMTFKGHSRSLEMS